LGNTNGDIGECSKRDDVECRGNSSEELSSSEDELPPLTLIDKGKIPKEPNIRELYHDDTWKSKHNSYNLPPKSFYGPSLSLAQFSGYSLSLEQL